MESVGFEHLRMEEVYNKRTLFFKRGICSTAVEKNIPSGEKHLFGQPVRVQGEKGFLRSSGKKLKK
jgi:hypothetical protein